MIFEPHYKWQFSAGSAWALMVGKGFPRKAFGKVDMSDGYTGDGINSQIGEISLIHRGRLRL